jgi:hypothetical protein
MWPQLYITNAVFWDVKLCGSCKNRRFGGTPVLTIGIWRNIAEDGIIHSHSRENLKSYTLLHILIKNIHPAKYE